MALITVWNKTLHGPMLGIFCNHVFRQIKTPQLALRPPPLKRQFTINASVFISALTLHLSLKYVCIRRLVMPMPSPFHRNYSAIHFYSVVLHYFQHMICCGILVIREFKKPRRRRRGQRRLKNEFIFYLQISRYSKVI